MNPPSPIDPAVPNSPPSTQDDDGSYHFDAFISYRHLQPDEQAAVWLHRALEGYRVPEPLVREGTVTRRQLNRICLDKEEFNASPSLIQTIHDELKRSRFLIVVCSPNAREARWINDEVRYFVGLGPERRRRVLTLLIEGEPADAFPVCLRDLDGADSDEPLAADLRPVPGQSIAEVRRLALLRLLAPLLGCDFDDLRQREQERQAQFRKRVILAMTAVLVLIGLGVAFLLYQMNEATRHRGIATQKTVDEQKARQDEALARRQRDDAEAARLAARAQADQRSYVLQARKLSQAHATRNPQLVLDLLDELRPRPGQPDFRGFEWHYFRNLVERRSGEMLSWGTDTLAFGPGGLFAGRDDRGAVLVHDPTTRQSRPVMTIHSGFGRRRPRIAFSPDGKTFAAHGQGNVELFALPSWEKRKELAVDPNFAAGDIAYSPGGKWLVARNARGAIRIWDANTHKPTGETTTTDDAEWRFSSDDRYLAVVERNKGRLLELPSGKEIRTWDAGRLVLADLEFSVDGKLVALGWGGTAENASAGLVTIQTTDTGAERAKFASDEPRSFRRFSPQSRFAVWTGNQEGESFTRVCETAGGKECFTLKQRSDRVSLAISPDDKWLASPSVLLAEKGRIDAVIVRDLTTGKERFDLPVVRPEAVAFSPDGNLLACYGNDELSLWDLATGRPLAGYARPIRRASKEIEGGPFPLPIERFHFSDDGRWVYCCWHNRMTSWFVGGPLPCREFREEKGITALGVTGDQTRLVHASNEYHKQTPGEVRLWNLATKQEMGGLVGHVGRVGALAFSADGTTLTVVSNYIGLQRSSVQLRRWDVARQNQLGMAHDVPADALVMALSAEGKQLALGEWTGNAPAQAPAVRLFDPATGQSQATLDMNAQSIGAIAYSRDGRWLAAGSDEGAEGNRRGVIRIWPVANPGAAFALKVQVTDISALAFAPDGQTLLFGCKDGAIKLWDLTTRTEVAAFNGHTAEVMALAFPAPGKLAASCSRDGTVRLWEVAQRREKSLLHAPTGEPLASLAFSPDGTLVAAGGIEGGLTLWNAGTGDQLAKLEGHTGWVQALSFSPDGKRLASGSGSMMAPGAHLGGYFSGSLTLRGLPDGEVIQRRPIRTDGITAISTPAKGRLIAFATGDVHGARGHVRVWDPDTGKERHLRGHADGVNALAFSRDGTTLVSGGADCKVILWDAETGEKRWVLDHPRSVSTLALSPDGKRVAVGSWGGDAEPASIVLYETATGNRLTTISARDGGIHDLVFSPTRDAVAWAGPDKSIRVWQNGMAEDGLTLRGHGEAVRSLAFSPDGNTLASGSDDGTVKLWDLATGQERLTLTEPSGAVVTVRFFDAGRSLVAGDSNGSVWIWTGWNSP